MLKANYACARDPKAAWIPVDAPACEVKGTLAHGANDLQVATIPPQEVKRRLDEDKALFCWTCGRRRNSQANSAICLE